MMSKAEIPVKTNDVIDCSFIDLTHDGKGVAKVDGYPLFVKHGLPGEKAQIKVTKVNKGYGFGEIIRFYETSPERVEPPCPIYGDCGGCQLQHLSYERQLQAKEKQVRDVLQRIGKLEDVQVHPVLGMEDPWRYRNKSQIPFGARNGRLIGGFFRPRTHEIIEMESCIIQAEKNDEVYQKAREICEKYGIKPYDEKSHTGILRHLMVRYGRETGETMIVLVTRTKDIPYRKKIVQELVSSIDGVTSIVQNINPERTNVILGDETRVLWGKEAIRDRIGEVEFEISARSFYQVNPIQTKVLYDKAVEYAGLTGSETVMDAYCGIGTISLFLARHAKKVYGVEIVEEAIEDAKYNAKINGIENVEFAVGKAEEVIPRWYEEGIEADVLVVDPPRKGCDPALLETIIKMKPKKVVYVSCNPATLARDLRILEDGNYKTIEVQPVDMFPQTVHVETVCLMSRK